MKKATQRVAFFIYRPKPEGFDQFPGSSRRRAAPETSDRRELILSGDLSHLSPQARGLRGIPRFDSQAQSAGEQRARRAKLILSGALRHTPLHQPPTTNHHCADAATASTSPSKRFVTDWSRHRINRRL